MGLFLGIARALFLSLLVSAVAAGNDGYKCQNPKVRREWRNLTTSERADWIRAVNCLAALPHDPNLAPIVPLSESLIPPVNKTSSHWDDIVYVHMDLNRKIHWTGLFFPFHRQYVQYVEDSLVRKCGYKGASPYWNWSKDTGDFYNSDFFDDSPASGVGAWGDPANDYQISTGGLKDIMLAYPSPHRIRRNFTLFPYELPNAINIFPGDPTVPAIQTDLMINTTMTKENVDYMVNNFEGDFEGFQAYMESISGVHPGIHLIISGDLSGFCPNGTGPPECIEGPTWSSNDPVFFMHHAMIDKVWYDWQNKSPKNKYAYKGGSVTPLPSYANYTKFPNGMPPYLNFDSEVLGDGLWHDITIGDVMDTTGDTLCYIYA